MVNWGIALGAGARSALDTYERLDDMERRESADKRQERALQLREQAAGRAESAFRQQQSDRQRALDIAQRFGGGQPAPEIPTGQAGARTSGMLNARAGSATPPVTQEAPSRGGALPAPAAAQPQAQPRTRGVDLGGLRDEYVRAGLFGQAKDVTNIMNADASREASRIKAKVARLELSEAERGIADKYRAQATEGMMALAGRLPKDDLDDINPDDPLVQGILDAAKEVKSFLSDGIGLEFDRDKEGRIVAKTIDLETGKVMGQKAFTKVGELRRYVQIAGALVDPARAAQWEANTAIAKRKAEMDDLEMTEKALDVSSKRDKVSRQIAESNALDAYRQLIKDPVRNEEQMSFIEQQVEVLSPDKWTVEVDDVDPNTGEKIKVRRNKLELLRERYMPLREVEVPTSDGGTTTRTVDEVIPKYVEKLPQALQESGGNPQLVLAQLRSRHDSIFRKGAFDRDVAPIIVPQIMGIVRQMHEGQMRTERGATPGREGQPVGESRGGVAGTGLGPLRAGIGIASTALGAVGQTAFGDDSQRSEAPQENRLRKFSPQRAANEARRKRLGLPAEGR